MTIEPAPHDDRNDDGNNSIDDDWSDPDDRSWYVYGRNTDDGLAFVRVRVDVHSDDHPHEFVHRLICTLPVASEDGFPDDEEAKQLHAVEEVLEAAAADAGILVGAVTEHGKRHLYFYTTEEFDSSVLQIAVPALSADKIDQIYDPEWNDYSESLSPSDSDRQINSDLQLIHTLQEHGDDLSAERPVDHFLYFEEEQDCNAAAISLSAQGEEELETSYDPDTEDTPYGIHFVRTHSLEPPELFEHTLSLLQLATDHNGYYDGWETPIVRADENTGEMLPGGEFEDAS